MANGLGRGLSSLIPQKTNKPNETAATGAPVSVAVTSDKDRVLQIEITKIDPNPMQPRKKFTDYQIDELVESIKEYGIIQPLVVSKKLNRFELIAGERRLRAAKKAGLLKVPAIIREAGNQEKLEVALVENIQRENLNPIDLAYAYQKLMSDYKMTQEDVAKRVGKSRPSVANTVRLISLPEEIKLALIDGKINEGHAKYIIGLEGEAKQMSLFRKILHNNLTVKDVDSEVKRMGGTKAARIKINYTDKDKEFALREFFGAKIEIKRKGKGGQIIIDFFSDEELRGIIEKVKK
jgi:ParB family transcriptional regulator, chromosome partitioning protein